MMVVVSTIFAIRCYIIAMMKKDDIYGIPNLGCLLGMAYQAEVGRLTTALNAAGIGITASEYLILRILYKNGHTQQCDFSRILGKDKASVNRSIHALARKGLVLADAVSYKCCMVSLTEEGVTLKPQIMEIARRLHNDMASKLTIRQMEDLNKILETIIK